MVVGIPLLQIVMFGYAINMDVRHLRAAVADEAQTSYSRQLAMDLQASQVLRYTARARSAADGHSRTRISIVASSSSISTRTTTGESSGANGI